MNTISDAPFTFTLRDYPPWVNYTPRYPIADAFGDALSLGLIGFITVLIASIYCCCFLTL